MKNNYLSKKRKLFVLSLFASLFMWGSGSVWADTLTENFNGDLPTDWSLVGTSISHNDDRARSGKGVWSSAYSDNANYLITEAVEGSLTFYARAYNKNTNAYVFVYAYDGSAIGDQLYVTSNMKTTSTPSFTSYTANLGSYKGQVAIALNFAAIDDLTYTQMEAISGPGFAVKDGSSKLSSPFAYNFGLATAGTTKVFTLSNPGTEATPISVDVTGANGFTAAVEENATSIPAGGQKTLTITMPDATASGSIVVTPTGAGLSAFTFNVSGTVRDPNKVYLDFAGGTMPEGWISVQTGSNSSYSWTAATGYIGTSGTSASYTHAFTSPKLVFAKDEVVMFKSARYNNKNYWDEPYTSSIVVEYSLDGSAWTAIGPAFTDDAYGAWTQRSVTIPVDGVQYIRFNGYDICLTEIYGGQLPLNPTPKSLGYSNVTNTSAQLNWTSTASNFNIQYKASGDADWTTIENVTANPYTLTGLSAVTTYQVKVQADHGVNGLSDYTDAISFTTKPNPISAYPYTENFNSLSSGEIPTYWDNSQGTTETESYKWVYYATGHDGACVRFDSYNNSSNKTNFLKTRPFNFTQGQPMKLTFWYKNPTGGDFSVYASTDGGATYPTELATGLAGKSDWTESEIDIPASVYGDNVVVVFKGTSNWGSGDAYIYLDDVVISEVSDYSLSISGSDVSGNTIAFGTVKNTTTTKTFTITNDGGSDLTDISVVSGDAEVFTVSDTGFDLASGATKVITVTFVKAVNGDYSKTITISQANIATPIVLTATATYATPTPATMAVTLDDVAVGETVAFGTVNKSTTKTFKVSNTGEATLNATIELSGTDAAKFTLSTNSLVVAGESEEEFTVTFDSDDEDVAKTAVVTLSAAGLSDVSFNVTGTYSNFWTEDFNEATGLPTGWITTNWTIGTYSDYENKTKMALAASGNNSGTLITPRLYAKEDEVLTWDAYYHYYDEKIKVEWSNDGSSWTEFINDAYANSGSYSSTYHKQMSFTAPADGNYYLRFTSTYSNGVDNFSGFKLNIPEHAASLTTNNVPASATTATVYTATATVKELAGKDETNVKVQLYVNGVVVDEKTTETLNADETKVFSVSYTPISPLTSVPAYVKVTIAEGQTDEVVLQTPTETLTISAKAITLDEEDTSFEYTNGATYDVSQYHSFAAGFNTLSLPYDVTNANFALFGLGEAQIFEFTGYDEGNLELTRKDYSTMADDDVLLEATKPYIIYSENAVSNTNKFAIGVVVLSTATTPSTFGGASFIPSYLGMAAGSLTGKYGVIPAGQIRKAGASASIKGFRAYFELPAAGVKSINYQGLDDATSINGIALEGMEEGQLYDLSGRRVNPATTRLNGIYILNGKKVLFK